MGLAPVLSTSVTTGTTDGTSSLSQLGEDYTRFLTLLTAQIENQDPLEPVDSTQFISQLAQLSQVEQAVSTNSNLENITAQMSSMLAASGASLLGEEVTVETSDMQLTGGLSDGYYAVESGASAVSAQIYDPDGNLVRTMSGLSAESAALQPLNWDGLNDSGVQLLDGDYTFSVTAVNGDGDAISTSTYRKATVEQVLFTEGQNYFTLTGDHTVAAEQVLSAG